MNKDSSAQMREGGRLSMYSHDQGEKFGKWSDSVSRLMYETSTPVFLDMVDTSGRVCDMGGGNGLLKPYISNLLTVDHDPAKKPDIVDDIFSFSGQFDLLIFRYVLHYLSDSQILTLFDHVKSFHNKPMLIIQFVNEGQDLQRKKSISSVAGEEKHFRTYEELIRLIPQVKEQRSINYTVNPTFYKNRLQVECTYSHGETLIGFVL